MMNDSSINRYKDFVTLGVILLSGVFLRFLLLNTYYFMPENHSLYDFNLVGSMIEQGKLSYAGRVSSIAGFRYSPIYHFMIYPVFYLFENEFTGMMVFTLFFDFSSLLIFFFLAIRYMKKNYAVLFCLLLFFGFYEVTELLTLWAVNMIPFFAALSFFSLVKIVEDNCDRWFVPLGFAVSAQMQIHTTGYVFFLYMCLVLYLFRRKFDVRWLVLGVLSFLVFWMPGLLQEGEAAGTNYSALLTGVWEKLFFMWRHKMVFNHSAFEYLYSGVYLAAIIYLIFARNGKSIFISDKVHRMFKVYAIFVFIYIFFYGGDIFQIYLYRGFNFIAFAGILVLAANHYTKVLRAVTVYAMINAAIVISIIFFGSERFVDFRNREQLVEFLSSRNAAVENIYNVSFDYKDEIVVGWYKYLLERESLANADADAFWVITEDSLRHDDLVSLEPVVRFGNISLFKLEADQIKEMDVKLKESYYYLFGIKDFNYTLDEIEYLWKH